MSDHQKSQAHKNCAEELEIRSAKLVEESNKKAENIWRERNSARIEHFSSVPHCLCCRLETFVIRVHSHLIEL